ncbi:siroheme decarboxylase subunit beta [Desulfoluna spongiiphila]|uniref:siroheme decarboxylase n=1 Tax=Desulfoluna spongiiphila TaxID=419481 RepID=A0A1G5JFU2_9BACT|nr:Lrp/AsnC family transcriptional regulator [Desulfoluna spongiiphila]SCY86780.1 transcriptional regulator, AsnC family [Desulfoluna spongiiphila]
MPLSDQEKQVISAIQGDIPVCENPYQVLAQGLDMTEEDFLTVLNRLHDKGLIRRFGATLRHQKSGFTANAMVAWQVEEARVEEVGSTMASYKEVSHCYRRNPAEAWPYNLYTMIHATSRDACLDTARRISEEAGVSVYRVLFSKQELKKISMTYFSQPGASVGA